MRRRPLCLLCLAIVLILAVIRFTPLPDIFAGSGVKKARALYAEPQSAVIRGVVESSDLRDDYAVCILKNVTLYYGNETYGIGKVRVVTSGAEYGRCGWVLEARGKLSAIRGPDNPGEFDAANYYRAKGIRFEMKKAGFRVLARSTDIMGEFYSLSSQRIAEEIRALYPEDVSGVLLTMLLGDKSGLEDSTRSLYQTGGIVHILAISGLHLTILGMGLFYLLRMLRLPSRWAALLTSTAMFAYMQLAGSPVSAFRAWIMFSIMLGAKLLGRTYDPPTALAGAASLLLITNPEYLTYSGFQMSCCVVLLIAVFQKHSRAALSLFVYIWMLPLTAWTNYEIPLLGAAVNLLVVPLMPVILGGSLIGLTASFVWSLTCFPFFRAASFLIAQVITALIRIIHHLLAFINALPFSSLITGKPLLACVLGYLALLAAWTCLYEKWRLLKRRFLLIAALPLLVLILIRPGTSLLRMTFLSVGQGDSILIEAPSGVRFLVDCGSGTRGTAGSRKAAPCIRYRGISKLDYIVVTHTDEDHINGIREILEMIAAGTLHIRVGSVVFPYLKYPDSAYLNLEEAAEAAGARIIRVRSGDRFEAGDVVLNVLGPDPLIESENPDKNGQCVVLSLSYRNFDALLTGDVSGEGEKQLLKQLTREPFQAVTYELLKVAHHGARSSTGEDFLERVRPGISIISCGRDNPYGHPHEELLSRLRACGTSILRTDQCGAVTVTTDGSSVTVSPFRHSSAGAGSTSV